MSRSNTEFYNNLQEDLIISAPLLFDLVEKHSCTYYNGTSFDWYHKSWQFLRILDKVSTPTWHTEFYFDVLSKHLKKNSKILISGTADYTILAIIIEASKRLSIKPDITIIDICLAPLKICEWYSKKENYEVKISQFDILIDENVENVKYDLIITDAFLTRFDDANKKSILGFWKNSISKNGIIVTTIRIDEADPFVQISRKEKENFVKTAKSKYQDFNLNYNIDIDKLALEYISNIKSFSYKSEEQLITDLKEQKFIVNKFDDSFVEGEAKETYYKRVVLK